MRRFLFFWVYIFTATAIADEETIVKEAKNVSAQSALQASKTAQVALLGKREILEKLEKEVQESRRVVERQTQRLEQVRKSSEASQKTLDEAKNQINVLITALKLAQNTVTRASEAAQASSGELASQSDMLTSAKLKLSSLTRELRGIQVDYEATQNAAKKATASAETAKYNVNQTEISTT